MALQCVVESCRNNNNAVNTVFNFPVPNAKKEKWLKALGLEPNHIFGEPTGVCELHFKPTHYKKIGKVTLLSINAIPEICLKTEPQSGSLKMEISDEESPQPPKTYSRAPNNPKMPIAIPMIEPDSIKIEVENDEDECNAPDPLAIPMDQFLNRIQNIQNRNKGNADLQAKMKDLKNKIRIEKQNLADAKKKFKRSARSNKSLTINKNKCLDELNKIAKLRRIYLKPELIIPKLIYDRFGMDEFDGLKYPKDLKQFAIELYGKSTVAYDYVREKLCNVIPHPDAILRWTKPQPPVQNED